MRPTLSLVAIATHNRSRLAVGAVAAVGALAVAGCGGGGDNSGTTAANPTTTSAQGAGGGSTVDLSAAEFKFNPADPSVKAGQVTFNVTNDGQIVHSLEVEGPGGDQELNSDLSPGDTGTLTVDLSKPGKYEFYCPIDSHKQQGMEGEVTVK
jgi:uncharacterized cupredoxin-like copper-binding protein